MQETDREGRGSMLDNYVDASTYKLQLNRAAETRRRCRCVRGPSVASDTREGEIIGVGLGC